MSFLKYAFKQKDKSVGKVFLFSLLLTAITIISIVVAIAREVNNLHSEKFLDEYELQYNCRIENYNLYCNDDLYEFGTAKIDLDYARNDLELGYEVIFTQTGMITAEGEISYESILTSDFVENNPANLDLLDALEYVDTLMPIIYTVVILFGFIGLMIFYPLGNLLLALIINAIINSAFKTKFTFKDMYRITIVTTIPYVLLNAITRMIFSTTITDLINVPLLPVVIDYAVIYLITYFAVKEGLKDQPQEEIVFEATTVEDAQNNSDSSFDQFEDDKPSNDDTKENQ